MKLAKRDYYNNIYDLGKGKRRGVFGGVPNVPTDAHRNLAPLDNEIDLITTHPRAAYVIKRTGLHVGFHDKITGKFMVGLKLFTGETMIKTLETPNPEVTPEIVDKRYIKWQYANGSWLRYNVDEKQIKEVVKQKAGQALSYRFDLNGFNVKKANGGIEFRRKKNGELIFKLLRPHYINAKGEFLSFFDLDITRIDDNTWTVAYPTPAEDKYIDPTVEFSDRGGGAFGGDHKCTFIRGDNTDRSYASDVNTLIRNIVAGAASVSLYRFSLTGHIPTNAIINSAVFAVTNLSTNAQIISAYDMITNWGITSTDEGVTQEPANAGQATFDNSFDYNGVGDVPWVGGGFTVADHQAAEATATMNGGDPAGTVYNFSIPIMVSRWVLNDALNYGLCMYGDFAVGWTSFNSNDAVNTAVRPYLTIDYTVPSDIPQSKIANAMGMGIGF